MKNNQEPKEPKEPKRKKPRNTKEAQAREIEDKKRLRSLINKYNRQSSFTYEAALDLVEDYIAWMWEPANRATPFWMAFANDPKVKSKFEKQYPGKKIRTNTIHTTAAHLPKEQKQFLLETYKEAMSQSEQCLIIATARQRTISHHCGETGTDIVEKSPSDNFTKFIVSSVHGRTDKQHDDRMKIEREKLQVLKKQQEEQTQQVDIEIEL